jgi:tetratricopeptide (TPR) repeat protein
MLDTGQIALNSKALMWFRRGLAAASTNDFERAIAAYNKVLDIQDDCYEVWYERGLALESRGDYVEAIASFDRALHLNPEDIAACEIWQNRGNAFQYGLGDYSQAMACYDQALRLNSKHEATLQNRGNALLYGLSLSEEALDTYSRVVTINPDNDLAWRNRGNALAELRRYDEAIASYDRALSLQPDDQVSWHARSLAAEKLGISDYQPTTHAAWYGVGFGEETFVEGDTDSDIIFASHYRAMDELPDMTQSTPVLILEDDWGRREIMLERDQYTLGRDPNSDICLHSEYVSRHHAVLVKLTRPDGHQTYEIRDGGLDGKASRNGLLINGRKWSTFTLQADDEIIFGPRVRVIYLLLSNFSG